MARSYRGTRLAGGLGNVRENQHAVRSLAGGLGNVRENQHAVRSATRSVLSQWRLPSGGSLSGNSLAALDPCKWFYVEQATDVIPLTPSLSPSDGERVPFRAGEGSSASPPSFRESRCLGLSSGQ